MEAREGVLEAHAPRGMMRMTIDSWIPYMFGTTLSRAILYLAAVPYT